MQEAGARTSRNKRPSTSHHCSSSTCLGCPAPSGLTASLRSSAKSHAAWHATSPLRSCCSSPRASSSANPPATSRTCDENATRRDEAIDGEACVRCRPTRASEAESDRREESRADEGDEGTSGEGGASPREAVRAPRAGFSASPRHAGERERKQAHRPRPTGSPMAPQLRPCSSTPGACAQRARQPASATRSACAPAAPRGASATARGVALLRMSRRVSDRPRLGGGGSRAGQGYTPAEEAAPRSRSRTKVRLDERRKTKLPTKRAPSMSAPRTSESQPPRHESERVRY